MNGAADVANGMHTNTDHSLAFQCALLRRDREGAFWTDLLSEISDALR